MTYSCAVKPVIYRTITGNLQGLGYREETVNLPMDIQFIEDREFYSFIESLGLSPEEYTGQNAKMIAVAKEEDEAEEQRTERAGGSVCRTHHAGVGDSRRRTPAKVQDSAPSRSEKQISLTLVDTIPLDTLPRNASGKKVLCFYDCCALAVKGNRLKLPMPER